MIKISPSLLAIEPIKISETIEKIPSADYLHIDVMDGKFVKEKTLFLYPSLTSRIHWVTDIPLDIHLMVNNPENYIDDFAKAGADMITFHYEACSDPKEIINSIKKHDNIKAGIALNPDTEISNIENIIEDVDMVLLMSVVPGRCGQGYIEKITDKISSLKEIIITKGYSAMIEVDGGIKIDNAYKPINTGADILVSGSGIFSQANPDKAIKQMKDVILLGCDHGGFELKNKIKTYLDEKHQAYSDVGTYSLDSCDYPDYAKKVAQPISEGKYNRGVLICGTGLGMSMAANRYNNVRAAECYDTFTAQMARKHNDANILCLGERSLDHKLAIEITEKWLNTSFSEGERHKKRIAKIDLY
ncbi:MAG: ribulose-phosphate 3-epimerase [Nanoarchaeota archaeon]|nr:ribulose-phosphate 3-epimerase [Nanoarchaeota archaeon]